MVMMLMSFFLLLMAVWRYRWMALPTEARALIGQLGTLAGKGSRVFAGRDEAAEGGDCALGGIMAMRRKIVIVP